MCPFQTKNLTQMCLWFKWFKSNLLDSNNFVANSTLSQLHSFWGALLAKIWWWGALKHFNGPGWWWWTMGLFNFLRKKFNSQWPHERFQLVLLIFESVQHVFKWSTRPCCWVLNKKQLYGDSVNPGGGHTEVIRSLEINWPRFNLCLCSNRFPPPFMVCIVAKAHLLHGIREIWRIKISELPKLWIFSEPPIS